MKRNIYMKESLLSHIASNFITQYENVANSGVSYLLNKYPAARKVLQSIVELDAVPKNYITELSTDSNGRPDITGIDEDGNKIVIIEGKFWANLTDNQPENYLKELSSEGKLLFLIPDKRLNSIASEIENRIGSVDSRIAIYSWISFLHLIEIENKKDHDEQLASDLMQLKELCMKMDEEGMPPLSASDLNPMNARLPYQFADIIDECNARLRSWDESRFAGYKSVGYKYGYGFYFKAYEFGCYLHYSSKAWFTKDTHTPIWLSIQDGDWKKHEKYYSVLDNSRAYNEKDATLYAIILQSGMDKRAIVEHIVDEVKQVLSLLHSKVS